MGPTPGQRLRRARGLVIGVVILLLAGTALALLRSGEQRGLLDPRSAEPRGSRATAELLKERGVELTVVTTTAEASAPAGPDTTLLVTRPDLLGPGQLTTLRSATSGRGGRLVLLGADQDATRTLAPGTRPVGQAPVEAREPDCDADFARRAGGAELGGHTYAVSAEGATSCYPHDGLPSLVLQPDRTGPGDTVLLGTPEPLYNNRLAEAGNASLVLQLLGSRDHLVWYLPSLADPAADREEEQSLLDLLPAGWRFGALQLALAVVLTALWRARRLGPLVHEDLPVAVHASETAEGRARLYHQTRARDRAADSLRHAARTRLAGLLSVSPGDAHTPEVLLSSLDTRLRATDNAVDALPLLFGRAPLDDAALVRLADGLDDLERRVNPAPQQAHQPPADGPGSDQRRHARRDSDRPTTARAATDPSTPDRADKDGLS
ncbi:DUF4350 domain-containing protein [Streptomyces durbertensis]|uniref:DUF4350 domain-containing protein n=1 Tax=Streptomyces durbertensis TaxID=2448886 RepID=A0ABR6EG79_9ACTN|nr:DUF4350 domain-containing protein [Streptomyces durbertensis]